jgi:hypothetical protein
VCVSGSEVCLLCACVYVWVDVGCAYLCACVYVWVDVGAYLCARVCPFS